MLDLFRSFRRPRRSSRRHRAAIPFGEALETRTLLAGNVAATFADGDLSLRGDEMSNSIEIAIEGDDIVLRGQDGTTINGSMEEFVIQAGSDRFDGDINLDLGRGADTLLMNGPLTIGGDVRSHDFSGKGQLGITDAVIEGDLRVHSFQSGATISLLNASVEGDLFLSLGGSRSFISLQDSQVLGEMTAFTGKRADTILLQGSTVGDLHAFTGRGRDNLIFRDSVIDGDFVAATGDGRDGVFFEDSSVAGDTQLWLWFDSDLVVAQGTVDFGGDFFAGGILGRNDSIDLSDETTIDGESCIVWFEHRSIDDLTRVNERIQEQLVEAATIQTMLNGVEPGDLTLTVDTSSNPDLVESNDTLVTTADSLLIEGTTLPFATVSITAGAGGVLDLGSVVADNNGNYSLTIDLLHGPTTIMVTATDQLDRTLTEEFDLHVAAGTVVRFESSLGSFDVELYDEDTPLTVANFLNYADRYIDSIVHRSARNQVDAPFVIQGGGFALDGSDELQMVMTDAPVSSEFSGEHSNVRGTLAMALTSDIFNNVNPDSGTSQWFVNLGDNSQLDVDEFTVFGEVIGSGMGVVDAIAALDRVDINDVVPLATSALNEVPLENYMLESVQLTGTISIPANSIAVTGTGTLFTSELDLNDIILVDGQPRRVADIVSDTELVVADPRAEAIVDANFFTEPIATTVPTREQYVVFSSIGVLLS